MKYFLFATLALLGCGSDAVDGTDASFDSSAADSTTKDQSAADSKADAPAADGAVDATGDGALDATADSALDASADAADDVIADAEVDAVALDAGKPVDGGCNSANDCKLFASYCSTASCKCLPLSKGDPNPVCNGQIVQCLIAPCLNKFPVCTDAGTCAVGP